MSLRDGLISYWKFDEASGTRFDAVGSNHLTDNNTVTQVAGTIGNAAQFTAANSEWLSVPDNPSLALTTAMSLSIWIVRDTVALSQTIAAKWTYHTDGEWVVLASNTDAAKLRVVLATSAGDDATGCRMEFACGQVPATRYHLVVVFDGSLTGDSNRLKLYQNNVPASLAVINGAVPATLLDGGADLNFGKYGGSLTNYFDGSLDMPALYSRALSAAEVAQLYNNGAGRDLSWPTAESSLFLYPSE